MIILDKIRRKKVEKTIDALRRVKCQAGNKCEHCPFSYYDPLDKEHELHCISIDAITYSRFNSLTRRGNNGALPR